MYYYVYKTTNLINEKFYYGVHMSVKSNDSYLGSGKLLRLAIDKYGVENFKKEIIKYFNTYEEALSFEKDIITPELIESIQCYNINIGGAGGSTKNHIKDFSKHKEAKSEEHKQKISNSLKGKSYLTDEGRKIISEKSKGNTARLGKKDSEETKLKKKESFAKSDKHAAHLKNVGPETRKIRSELIKIKRSTGWDPMKNPENRAKISKAKTGLKKLTKDGVTKMAKPGSEKWNDLIEKGFN